MSDSNSNQPTGSFPPSSRTNKGSAAAGGSSDLDGNPTGLKGSGGVVREPTTAQEMGITGGNDMSLRGMQADYKGQDHTRPASEAVEPGQAADTFTGGAAGDQVKQVHSHEVDKIGREPRMS